MVIQEEHEMVENIEMRIILYVVGAINICA